MTFSDLHQPGNPFVLPNAWDVGSARALAAAGFPAIGTTSLGVAAAHGRVDAAHETYSLTLDLVASLKAAGLGRPLNIDLEDGFSTDPGAVADLVSGLDVAGVNLEDETAGVLVDPVIHARRIAAVVAKCPGVFVNARTDVLWLGSDDLDDAIERAKRYLDAGADGIFLPGSLDAATVERFVAAVPAPVNVLASPALTRHRLAELGVARISTGSLLYRAAVTGMLESATAVRDGRAVPPAIGYREVQELNSADQLLPPDQG